MGFGLRSLLMEVGKSHNSVEITTKVWNAIVSQLTHVLTTTNKGFTIKNFLSITAVRSSVRDPQRGNLFRVFFLNGGFCRSYGLSYRKPGNCLLSPCLDLNTSKICVQTGLTKDVVVATVKAIIAKVGEQMGGGNHVRIPIGAIGTLLSERRNVSFKMAENRSKNGPEKGPPGEVESWVDTFMKRKGEEEDDAVQKKSEEAEFFLQQYQQQQQQTNQIQERQEPPRSLTPATLAPTKLRSATPKPATEENDDDYSDENFNRLYQRTKGKFSDTDYSVEKDKLEHAMVNSVFPKFLTPDQNKYVHKVNNNVKKNMEKSYQRLHDEIAQAQLKNNTLNLSITKVNDDAFQDYLEKKRLEAARKEDLTSYLKIQREFDQKRRKDALTEMKSEKIQLQGFKAYPMAAALDIKKEQQIKQNLRESLELQVKTKTSGEGSNKKKEIDRETKILKELRRQLKKERLEKLQATSNNHASLSNHWDRQIAIRKKMQDIFN